MIIKCRHAKVFFTGNRIKSRGEEVGGIPAAALRAIEVKKTAAA